MSKKLITNASLNNQKGCKVNELIRVGVAGKFIHTGSLNLLTNVINKSNLHIQQNPNFKPKTFWWALTRNRTTFHFEDLQTGGSLERRGVLPITPKMLISILSSLFNAFLIVLVLKNLEFSQSISLCWYISFHSSLFWTNHIIKYHIYH